MTLPVAVDLLAFIIFSTMELPITTPLLLPLFFSFPFISSIVDGSRPLVTLGVRLCSVEANAEDPGLDLVADVFLPEATDVIKFGGASVGKSGRVAGKRDRFVGEMVRPFGMDSGFFFAGTSLMIFLTGLSKVFGATLLLIGSDAGVSGREDDADATDLALGEAGLGLLISDLNCLLWGFLSGICLMVPSLLSPLMDLSTGFGSSFALRAALRMDGGLGFVSGVPGREEAEEEATDCAPGDWGLSFVSSFFLKNLPG